MVPLLTALKTVKNSTANTMDNIKRVKLLIAWIQVGSATPNTLPFGNRYTRDVEIFQQM